ncbi:hypothetical protein J2Y40_000389 [Chryseobacterium sp. 2987]|nr:hypothetical protein [Chryseobacterium sp. 2987]
MSRITFKYMKYSSTPNYKKIYEDILVFKFPNKKEDCKAILSKNNISVIDIIRLNEIIFGTENLLNTVQNQRFRSYDKSIIFEMLEYQKKNNLNNTELANHFKLSRNTVTKWKKMFII